MSNTIRFINTKYTEREKRGWTRRTETVDLLCIVDLGAIRRLHRRFVDLLEVVRELAFWAFLHVKRNVECG